MPTLANIRSRVQVKIRDTDSRKGTFGVVAIDHAIADACLSLGSQIPAPHVYLSSGLTIAAGETFTLPTAAQTGYVSLTQYAGDIRIRLRSNSLFLIRNTVEELDAWREGLAAGQVSGVPERFCLWQEMDDEAQGRCWPPAATSEACDLFVSLVPDDLRDHATDMDAVNVRFSRYGSAALVFHTAALLVKQMSAEDVKLRNLNPAVAEDWELEARVLLYQEEVRKHNNEAIGRMGRWVS